MVRELVMMWRGLIAWLSICFSPFVLAAGLHGDFSDGVFIQDWRVDIETEGRYVSGKIEIRFSATTEGKHAADLRFPLPKGAVLYQAEIFIPATETWMRAETLGRLQGAEAFFEAVAQDEKPLLIQQIGTDFYRARVYPIDNQANLQLRLYYAHVLDHDGTDYYLNIPFANPDANDDTPSQGLQINVQSPDKIWQDSQWQRGDDALAQAGTVNHAQLSLGSAHLALDNASLDQDIRLKMQPQVAFENTADSLRYQPDDRQRNSIAHAWWQPELADVLTDQVRSNVVLVLDISGSMSGSPLEQEKLAIKRVLNSLAPEDYFSLVAFDSQAHAFSDTMQSGTDKAMAVTWVDNLISGGGTAIAAGLRLASEIALSGSTQNEAIDLFLLTDGHPNEGSSTVFDLVKEISNKSELLSRKIRIFTVGIGDNLDQDLLNGIAQETGGDSTFALQDGEISGQVLDLFNRARSGGLQLNKASWQQPLALQTFALENRYLFLNERLQLGAAFAQTDSLVDQQIKLVLDGQLPDFSLVHQEIELPLGHHTALNHLAAPLTAKAWADALERDIDINGEDNNKVSIALRIARTYGIVTRYSSLLALSEESAYDIQGIQRLSRDQAGIALQEVTIADLDETRIGGDGIEENASFDTTPSISADSSSTPPSCVVCNVINGGGVFSGGPVAVPPPSFIPSVPGSLPLWIDTFNRDPEGFKQDKSGLSYQSDKDACYWPYLDEQLTLYLPLISFVDATGNITPYRAQLKLAQKNGNIYFSLLRVQTISQVITLDSDLCGGGPVFQNDTLSIPFLIAPSSYGEQGLIEVLLRLEPNQINVDLLLENFVLLPLL